MLNSAKCALPEIPDEIERLPKLKHGSLATPPRLAWFLPVSRAPGGAGFSPRGGTRVIVAGDWHAQAYPRNGLQRQVALTNVTTTNYERPRPRDRGTRAPPPPLVG